MLVIGSGLLLFGLALAIIGWLPLTPGWRALVRAGWLLLSGTELYFVWACYADFRTVRLFADGSVELERRDGSLEAARLANGTVVLEDYAWLRFVTASGRSFGEPVTRQGQGVREWRRLTVISRHSAA